MSNYRTIGQVEEEYLRSHPEEVDDNVRVYPFGLTRRAHR